MPASSALERWLARRLGDEDSRRFGSGWASGTISVFLGLCGLGAVAVLHFPGWLASAELRAQYPVDAMRALIAGVIGIGFLLGCVSLLLRRRRVLGATAVLLAALAMLAGGSAVEIDGRFDTPVYLGLDWFLLNLFVFAVVFVPLERMFPRQAGQRVLRAGWATDTAYFAVSHLGIQLLTFGAGRVAGDHRPARDPEPREPAVPDALDRATDRHAALPSLAPRSDAA